MVKEEKTFFHKALIIVGIIFFANIGILIYNFSSSGLTGFSIAERLNKTLIDMPTSSKIFLIAQWALIILFLFLVFIKDKGVKSRKQELLGINLNKLTSKKGTDLDTLYSLLQYKKKLRLSTIAKLFDVEKNTALEWCKTLESGNLVEIDYPGMGEAVVSIVNR